VYGSSHIFFKTDPPNPDLPQLGNYLLIEPFIYWTKHQIEFQGADATTELVTSIASQLGVSKIIAENTKDDKPLHR